MKDMVFNHINTINIDSYELLEKFYDSEKEKIITENEFTINLTIRLFYKDDEGNLYNYKLK